MPFLRFARDKRGYETTSLVHAFRNRQGRTRQKVLYWFRTPPGVKVGRPALDQEAIRWIEDHNPDVEFDWPAILEATPPPAAPPVDANARRSRRVRSERSERGDRRDRPAAQAPSAQPVSVAAAASALPVNEEPPEEALPEMPPSLETPEQEALEQITRPDVVETTVTLSAVETVLGREQLIRFRARYAELQARIIERGGGPVRVEELRGASAMLDPDSWVTVEEARKGLEVFEPKIRELRAALGLKRRRRSRRGGRRSQNQPLPDGSTPQTTLPDASSNTAESDAPEAGEPDDGEPDASD